MKQWLDYVDPIYDKLRVKYPNLRKEMISKVLKYVSHVLKFHMWRGTKSIHLTDKWSIQFNPNARNWFKRKGIIWKKDFKKGYKPS